MVGVARPQIDDRRAVERDGDGGTDFIAGAEAFGERLADGGEAPVALTLDLAAHANRLSPTAPASQEGSRSARQPSATPLSAFRAVRVITIVTSTVATRPTARTA